MAVQPDAATVIDQGNTYRCGPYSILQWWDAAGYREACQNTVFWARAISEADDQRGVSFGQVLGLCLDWSWSLDVPVRLFEDGFCRDFATMDQLLRDNWCLAVGVWEQDLVDPAHPEFGPQRYFHFLDINALIDVPNQWNTPVYTVSDPFHKYDGEDGVAAVPDMVKAIEHNWHPSIIGVAWRFD